MTEQERLEFVRHIQEGSEAAILLLHEDLEGWVEKIRQEYIKDKSISHEEAFGISMSPIYDAAMAYDFNSNADFTTFAYYYVRGAIVERKYELKGVQLYEKQKNYFPVLKRSFPNMKKKTKVIRQRMMRYKSTYLVKVLMFLFRI